MSRHLITSALPYINGVKHLGNLVGSMLPADVYARYLRLRGHDVLFICATDEHGTPAELAALEAGVPVEDYCAELHKLQAQVYSRFALSFDYFGRSSSPQNRDQTQHLGRRLDENGLVREQSSDQIYSPTDGRFLPDRYVIGTCPFCGYQAARGDQCESCTRLLDPLQLVNPRSAVSQSSDLEVRTSRHLYFLQSKLAPRLRTWIEAQKSWPVVTTSIALKWLNEGLEDRCITRDLQWGVRVDRPGFEDKVYYVWFDAPIEYIGATREWADQDPQRRDWRSWWYAADDVRYTQFMAKDNVPFHTIMFPATLIGTGEPWKLADYIKGVNWLNYYGGKFSSSRKYGIFMDDALDILPSDYWRYYLIANIPESDDASFTWEALATQINKDLADTLGNFVNRVLTLGSRLFGPVVPGGADPGEAEQRLEDQISAGLRAYQENLEALHLRRAAQELRALWAAGNAYINLKAPWQEVKQSQDSARLTLRTAMNLIYFYGQVSAPIIPETAQALQSVFAIDAEPFVQGRDWPDTHGILDRLEVGTPLRVPDVMFRKITDHEVEAWRSRFGAPE